MPRERKNIDLVTPTHFLPDILPALAPKLPAPVVYNCGGYESVETLRHLEGLVDIYLPDLKYADGALAPGCPVRQTMCQGGRRHPGDGPANRAIPNGGGEVRRGVMIRHLILPGQVENSLRVLDWIGETFPQRDRAGVPHASIYPDAPGGRDAAPDRQVTQEEYEAVLSWMYLNNLEGFTQEAEAASEKYIPNFKKAINVCLHFCRTCVILKEKGGGIMPRTSNKQEEILQYIDQFVAENGYPPSVREIGAAVGLRSTASVSYHLNHLQTKGLVTYEAGKKRALSVPNAKTGQIPIIGVVTAGIPILAVENQEGTMPWDGDPNCFALRVRGDSMIGAAILDGGSGGGPPAAVCRTMGRLW